MELFVSLVQNAAGAADSNTGTLVLAATATVATTVLAARKKKPRLAHKFIASWLQKRKRKGNAGVILLGILALLLGIGCLAGIFYFMAVGNYVMVIVCGIIPVLMIVAYFVTKK